MIFQEIIEEPLNVPLYRLKLDNVDKCNKQISAEIVLEFFNQIQWFQNTNRTCFVLGKKYVTYTCLIT